MSDADDRLELIRKELPNLKVDQGKIKLREWDDLEEKVSKLVTPWVGSSYPPMWFLKGVLWLWLRRDHPQLTYEDFGELDLAQLKDAGQLLMDDLSDEPDPTGGEPAPPSSPPSATSGE